MEIISNLHILTISIILFVDEVEAFKDAWMIGDAFINNIWHMFPAMYEEAIVANSEKPYLFESYNVECFSYDQESETTTRNVLARIVNAFIKALNNKKRNSEVT